MSEARFTHVRLLAAWQHTWQVTSQFTIRHVRKSMIVEANLNTLQISWPTVDWNFVSVQLSIYLWKWLIKEDGDLHGRAEEDKIGSKWQVRSNVDFSDNNMRPGSALPIDWSLIFFFKLIIYSIRLNSLENVYFLTQHRKYM